MRIRVAIITMVLTTTALGVCASAAQAATPSGKFAFATPDGVFVARADGRGVSEAASSANSLLGSGPQDPAWSPHGQQIAYSSNDGTAGRVHVVSANGSNDRALLTLPATTVTSTGWSRATNRIAFATTSDAVDATFFCWCPVGLYAMLASSQIYVVNPDGTGLTAITVGLEPSWSPDGKQIAYMGVDGSLYVITATAGAVPRRISPLGLTVEEGSDIGYPVWSPTGRQIAFVGYPLAEDASADPFIYVVNSDGSSTRSMPWWVYGEQPSWSPDGRHLAYVDGVGIETTAVGGSGHLLIGSYDYTDTSPAWSPDGTHIAYVHEDPTYGQSLWLASTHGRSPTLVSYGLDFDGTVNPPLVWAPADHGHHGR